MLNSISNYSSIGTRKGIGGLASGLDTDALVEGMTQSTRNKLTKQLQSKEMLGWKMSAYHGTSSKLASLSSKYMSFTSSTNLMSQSFFLNNIISSQGSNSKAVTATGSSDILSKLKINKVSSLASSAGFITSGNVSSGKITGGEIDLGADGKTVNNLAGETITFGYKGVGYSVKIDKNFTGTTVDEVQAELIRAMGEVKTNIKDGVSDPITGEQKYKTLADLIDVTSGTETVDVGGVAETVTFLKFAASDPNDKNQVAIANGTGKSMEALGVKVDSESKDPSNPIKGTFRAENQTSKVKFGEVMAGKTMTFNLNGIEKKITFPADATNDAFSSMDKLQEFMQKEFNDKFGVGKVKVNLETGGAGATKGNLSFSTNDANSTLTFSNADEGIAGFKGAMSLDTKLTNRIDTTKYLHDANLATVLEARDEFKIKINGQEFTFDKKKSVKEIISEINLSEAGVNIQYMATTDKFSITASETGAHGKIDIEDVDGNLAEALFGKAGGTAAERGYTVTSGTDAVMEIDMGQGPTTITRTSNSFTLDGITFALNSKFDSATIDPVTGKAGDAITFTSKQDTEEVIEAVKQFIKDYNELIATVNKEVSTRPNKNYTPLTAEQADSMTETQVKDWEAKAKEGLLFGDSTMNNLAKDMRFAFSMEIPGLGMSLKDMGITSSTQYKENGKIMLDEAKLKTALEQNPDAVMRAFTKPNDSVNPVDNPFEGGLMNRVQNLVKKYAGTTGDKGSLITLAGTENALYIKDSMLYKQTENIDKEITRLQKSLKAEEDRYFRQFTTLEKYISQMNAQSSWLTQQ